MSSAIRKQYPFPEFEPVWQKRWLEENAFGAANPGDPGFDASRPKFYVLDMFPYPSGQGLHVGHVEGYTATDIVARYKRLRGFNVLHPMGWDAFGLPAEQYAIKTGRHPRITTENNINRFREQLQAIGFSYDWNREFSTTDPAYYKWTQWIFLQLYGSWFNPESNRAEPIETCPPEQRDGARLAYVSEVPVNWCPGLGTVLANEEVVDGKSEVGGFPVERRPMRQWMLRITAYAERLLNELADVDWPESIKLLQRNWIGRSEGALVTFSIADSQASIEVFTTRPDTLFGATYMVLAPEHPLVEQVVAEDRWHAVREYREKTARKSDLERTELAKDKTGVFTGAYAVNPVNGERIPVWIADYVLLGYGTGAIMAVPAHDERDFEFAEKFDLPIRQVVAPGSTGVPLVLPECFSGEGVAINSPPIDGLPTAEAKAKMTAWLEERGAGRGTVNYKLRDWLFSRQRYWGEPFPVVWENGRHCALPETELPVEPPELDDFRPTGTPEPPLAKSKEWVRYSDQAVRETNTMPQWAGSCWYFLRFCDPSNDTAFASVEAQRYWLGEGGTGGVDLYVGGAEHAVLHLLYARFWHKVLYDIGMVSTREPFHKLVNQGIILGPDGQKMAKSRGNVVNPDEVIRDYGADALRLYEMFMGPLEQMKPWSMQGVEGVYRFLGRVWRLAFVENQAGEWQPSPALTDAAVEGALRKTLHATIKKVTEDIESFGFNTAISQMMILTNELTSASARPVEAIRSLLVLLSPFAPHLAEEMWERLGQTFPSFESRASLQNWPAFDEAALAAEDVEIVVQINGKLRDRITVAKGTGREELERLARASEKVGAHLEGLSVVKVIAVPDRLVNIVAK